MKYLTTLFTVAAVFLASNAFAESVSFECTGTGTFQSGGEYAAYDYFFNVEGSSNGSYASWGGVRWTNINLGVEEGYTCEISEIDIALEQSNSSFTADGPVKVYLISDSVAPEIQNAGNLNYAYKSTIESTGILLATYDFKEESTGYADTISLNQGDSGFSELATSIQDGTLVLAFVEGSSSVAATWGGIGNYNAAAPSLNVSYSVTQSVPEPSTFVLLAIGGFCSLGCVIKRRNRIA